MTKEQTEACAVVEAMLRELDACEVRPWSQPWFDMHNQEVDVSIMLRAKRLPCEVAGHGLAAAIDRAFVARAALDAQP